MWNVPIPHQRPRRNPAQTASRPCAESAKELSPGLLARSKSYPGFQVPSTHHFRAQRGERSEYLKNRAHTAAIRVNDFANPLAIDTHVITASEEGGQKWQMKLGTSARDCGIPSLVKLDVPHSIPSAAQKQKITKRTHFPSQPAPINQHLTTIAHSFAPKTNPFCDVTFLDPLAHALPRSYQIQRHRIFRSLTSQPRPLADCHSPGGPL